MAFEKSVAARFTTDNWTTVSEAHARYVSPAPDACDDLFAFTIPLEAAQPRTLLLALRYAVPGVGEWWDNNGGADFRVVLAHVPGATPGFGVRGLSTAALRPPRRAIVGACRADVAAVEAYAHPMLALSVPPATG
jgi:hypothetical protein